jgi:hypothetical protein
MNNKYLVCYRNLNNRDAHTSFNTRVPREDGSTHDRVKHSLAWMIHENITE